MDLFKKMIVSCFDSVGYFIIIFYLGTTNLEG